MLDYEFHFKYETVSVMFISKAVEKDESGATPGLLFAVS